MIKKTIFLLAFIFQIACINDANAFQLRLEVKIDNKDSVWIGGPVLVEVSLSNKSKRSKEICVPDEDYATRYYIKRLEDTTWRQIQMARTSDCTFRASAPKLNSSETYKFAIPLFIEIEKWKKIEGLLVPNQEYTLRTVYFKKTKKWKSCSTPPKWNINQPDQFGFLYQDVKFHTTKLDTTELKAYQWIKENHLGRAFVDRHFYYSWSEKEKESIKQFICLFPDIRFTPWAAYLIVNSNISRYVSTEKDVKRLRENKSELELVQTCIDVLLRAKDVYFRETGEDFFRILEMYK
jgi:hypothetical protein